MLPQILLNICHFIWVFFFRKLKSDTNKINCQAFGSGTRRPDGHPSPKSHHHADHVHHSCANGHHHIVTFHRVDQPPRQNVNTSLDPYSSCWKSSELPWQLGECFLPTWWVNIIIVGWRVAWRFGKLLEQTHDLLSVGLKEKKNVAFVTILSTFTPWERTRPISEPLGTPLERPLLSKHPLILFVRKDQHREPHHTDLPLHTLSTCWPTFCKLVFNLVLCLETATHPSLLILIFCLFFCELSTRNYFPCDIVDFLRSVIFIRRLFKNL